MNCKILTTEEEKKLSKEELISYYNEFKNQLKSDHYLDFSDTGMIIREKLNPLIKKILNVTIKYDVFIDGLENIPNAPVIYACSHQEFNDVINSIYSYPTHTLTLSASNIRPIIKQLFNINGAFFLNRNDKSSRIQSKYEVCKALSKGKSVNIYPEATWNCTPSKLHLPFYIGIIDIARITNTPIIPVVQEYNYDQSKLDGKAHIKSVHIRFGKPIYVSLFDDRIEKLNEFDDSFSTIRWSLIEEKGLFKRETITNMIYVDYIKARIRQWKIPNNQIHEERKQIFHAQDDYYLFNHINDVEFDARGDLLPTSHVRKLIKLNQLHLKRK